VAAPKQPKGVQRKRFGVELITRAEYKVWLSQLGPKECPFCKWRQYQHLLYEGNYWLWVSCRAPYWKYHTMLIPKRHFRRLDQMTVVETGELIQTYGIALKKLRRSRLEIDGQRVNQFLFFWRLRDQLFEDPHGLGSEASRLHRKEHG
jgi:hypothetical protein